jgi:serine/threonine-protein phosphatase 2A regulatory subunit A
LLRQLSEFTPLVGGAAFAHTLLPVLESLAHVEETIVREKAVEALVRVCEQLPVDHVEKHFVPLITHLSSGLSHTHTLSLSLVGEDWYCCFVSHAFSAGDWFASRASACGLFGAACKRVSEPVRAELRALFTKVCEDDTPMVRRAAASNLGKIAESAT